MMIEFPFVLIEAIDAPEMFDPMGGRGLMSVIIPETPGLNTIVLLPTVVFPLKIAWRKEPGPLSFVFVTGKFAPDKEAAWKREK